MQPAHLFAARELTWIHPRTLKPEFELSADGKVLATLRLKNVVGSLTEAEAADGRWTFRRTGWFFHSRVTARSAGTQTDHVVVVRGRMGSGMLRFSDGRGYNLMNESPQGSQWAITAEDGTVLIRFLLGVSLRGLRGVVQVHPAARGLSDFSLLLLLGWYWIVLSLWTVRWGGYRPREHPSSGVPQESDSA